MTQDQAKRKYDALQNMTEARGCTPHEARTARRLAAQLSKRFGFTEDKPRQEYRPDFNARWSAAAERAASRFG